MKKKPWKISKKPLRPGCGPRTRRRFVERIPMHDYHLHLEHITRVEGHGNIVINIKKGQIEELRM
ncbi:MAG: hypothetical protein Q6354_10045, partial [Candidatus Brocadiales bacterium]|nr:hypothetical protein [Candidatus Brocadiales bacterium]